LLEPSLHFGEYRTFKDRVKILKRVRNGLIIMICPESGLILLSSLLPVVQLITHGVSS
jgi:hypothetical protein